MSAPATDQVLPGYFTTAFNDKAAAYEIKCKHSGCSVGFAVRSLELRPGALLALLNHAHSHDRKVRR